METIKKLKVLKPGLLSPFKEFQYELDKWYTCPDFNSDLKKDCSRGFYATDIEGLPYTWNVNMECYEVEVAGRSVIYNIYKQRFEKQRIIRKVEKEELISLAKAKEDELGYLLSEVLFPVNPLSLNRTNVTKEEKALLSLWVAVWRSFEESARASVWASVGGDIWTSVRTSIWTSVRASVWASVGPSVWESVRASICASAGASVRASFGTSVQASVWASFEASVWESFWTSVQEFLETSFEVSFGASVSAYISSLFPNIKKWDGIDHKEGENPFQSGADLWRRGLVPSFDGEVWRLHGGKNAKVLYELKV